ncbi:MAG: hypothetical protein R3F59_03725 [Myxococcota bacterium]
MSAWVPVPVQRRALAFAAAFRDVFVPAAEQRWIEVPLDVRALGVAAVRGADRTWRVSLTGRQPAVPAGTFPITVAAPGGEYVAFDPLDVTLPLATSSPPLREELLLVYPLWPTRRLRLPPGETAVHGAITQLGVPQPGLRVLLHPGPTPPPGTPEARTDAAGELVYRFPLGPSAATGSDLVLTVTVLDGAVPVPVVPASLTLAPGRVHTVSFLRP